jgi:adenosylhomocysteine nucleosidase
MSAIFLPLHKSLFFTTLNLMIGLIGAMEDEITLLRALITNPRTETVGGFEFFSGPFEAGKEVALLRCGIGKVNAAVGCALLIERFHPDFVLHTGSAGGINNKSGPALSFGDAVISSGLVYHDADVTAFNYAPGQIPGMPPVFPADSRLVELAEKAVDELKAEGILPAAFNYVRGLIGSGDVFMHEPSRIAAATGLFPEMRAVDMESAAVAQACFLFSVPCLVIRALSDIAGTESPMTHDQFLPIASKHSCGIVRRIIKLHKQV